MAPPQAANYTSKERDSPLRRLGIAPGVSSPEGPGRRVASSTISGDAEIPGHADEARQVEPARLHDLPVAEIATQHVPHRLAGVFSFAYRRPARHFIGLVGLDR